MTLQVLHWCARYAVQGTLAGCRRRPQLFALRTLPPGWSLLPLLPVLLRPARTWSPTSPPRSPWSRQKSTDVGCSRMCTTWLVRMIVVPCLSLSHACPHACPLPEAVHAANW